MILHYKLNRTPTLLKKIVTGYGGGGPNFATLLQVTEMKLKSPTEYAGLKKNLRLIALL